MKLLIKHTIFLSAILFLQFQAIGQRIYKSRLPELIPYKVDSLFGYIDSKMNIIIGSQYNFAEPFNDNCWVLGSEDTSIRKYGSKLYASVVIKGLNYRIDKIGKIVCSYNISNIFKVPGCIRSWNDFQEPYGLSRVFYKINGKIGVKGPAITLLGDGYDEPIDTLLNPNKINFTDSLIVIPAVYDSLTYIFPHTQNFRLLFAKSNGKIGVVTDWNRVLIPIKYDNLILYDYDLLLATLNKESFFVDWTGKEYRNL